MGCYGGYIPKYIHRYLGHKYGVATFDDLP